MPEKPVLPVRDTDIVPRRRIFVDHGRNLSRGGRAIDPNAPSTIELAVDIGERDRLGQGARGLLVPISVRRIPPTKDGQDLRLVSGYRRITALDLLHEGDANYPVLVSYSNATTDFEEALECFAENHVLPPKDFELAEGISRLRTAHGLEIGFALEKIYGKGSMNGETVRRVMRAVEAWEGLIQPLRELWKKNTPYFQLDDDRATRRSGAYRCAKTTPLEQEEFLERLINADAEDAIKAKIGPAADPNHVPAPRPEVPSRPTKRQINRALLSLKVNALDTHEDGLTKEQRAWAFKLFRWLLGIPVDGKKPRCPVRMRRISKNDDMMGEDETMEAPAGPANGEGEGG